MPQNLDHQCILMVFIEFQFFLKNFKNWSIFQKKTAILRVFHDFFWYEIFDKNLINLGFIRAKLPKIGMNNVCMVVQKRYLWIFKILIFLSFLGGPKSIFAFFWPFLFFFGYKNAHIRAKKQKIKKSQVTFLHIHGRIKYTKLGIYSFSITKVYSI